VVATARVVVVKIALVVDRFGPGTGTGGQAFLAASSWRERHEVTVWVSSVSATLDGVDVRPLPRLTRTPPDGGVRVAFGRVRGCEVVRASGGVHAAYLRACVRWPRPRDVIEAVRDRAAARGARRVVCNAERVGADVVAFHRVDPAAIRIVRNGVDLGRFVPDAARRERSRQAWGVPPEGRVAAFLAHGFRRKNLATAVAAFARVARDADRLVVAGRDAHAGRWLRDARRLLGAKLVVCGPVAVPEEVLAGADALLHPTLYDAAANVVLEALACGVPPVTTVMDGAAEILEDRSLVVADALDGEEVAAALDRAWTLGTGARWRGIAERWPDVRMVEALERIVVEAAGGT
jgi:glycosyltransferase involved in cell wall biosynthesis